MNYLNNGREVLTEWVVLLVMVVSEKA